MKKIEDIWEDIPDCNKLYQASSTGKIRSIDHFVRSSHGKGTRLVKGKELKQSFDKRRKVRYFIVDLSMNGKRKTYGVHRLVACSFYRKSLDSDFVVRHRDGNSLNNNISNLLIGTVKDNFFDRIIQGRTKLLVEDINGMKIKYKNGEKQKEIAQEYKVDQSHVSRVVNNKCWVF